MHNMDWIQFLICFQNKYAIFLIVSYELLCTVVCYVLLKSFYYVN